MYHIKVGDTVKVVKEVRNFDDHSEICLSVGDIAKVVAKDKKFLDVKKDGCCNTVSVFRSDVEVA